MSAFIVEPVLINKILTYLNIHSAHFNSIFSGQYALDQTDDLDKLATALYNLNCAGVDARYGSNHAATVIPLTYRPVEVSPEAVYKAAQCLRYQCHEGQIPNHDLYKRLVRVIAQIADNIVSASPAYKAAKWSE